MLFSTILRANLLIAARQRRSQAAAVCRFAFLELAIGFAAVVIFADAQPGHAGLRL
jgi:hypothetical protein